MTEKSKKSPCKFFSNPSKNCLLMGETCERSHADGITPENDPCYMFKLWREYNERKNKV